MFVNVWNYYICTVYYCLSTIFLSNLALLCSRLPFDCRSTHPGSGSLLFSPQLPWPPALPNDISNLLKVAPCCWTPLDDYGADFWLCSLLRLLLQLPLLLFLILFLTPAWLFLTTLFPWPLDIMLAPVVFLLLLIPG